jgi:hypothetical protein
MPPRQGTRPLKRWCYVAVFSEEALICAANVRVGPLRQSFWAHWDRTSGTFDEQTRLLRTRPIRVGGDRVTVRSGDARLELALSPAGDPVEVLSPHGRSYIWTRKTPVRALGHYAVGMDVRPVSGTGILDESAGYHARRTEWEWTAGSGVTVDGHAVTWNLVRGIHDGEHHSERTVWLDGRPVEAPPVRFSPDLDDVVGADGSILTFEAEAVRGRRDNLGLISSEYTAPFGRFAGRLPGGIELSEHEPALGVMERHRARW